MGSCTRDVGQCDCHRFEQAVPFGDGQKGSTLPARAGFWQVEGNMCEGHKTSAEWGLCVPAARAGRVVGTGSGLGTEQSSRGDLTIEAAPGCRAIHIRTTLTMGAYFLFSVFLGNSAQSWAHEKHVCLSNWLRD